MQKAALLLALTLAACGEPVSEADIAATRRAPVEPAPAAEPTPQAAGATPMIEAPLWDAVADAQGISLRLTDAGAASPGPVLRMTCQRDGAFTLRGERFQPTTGVTRMTLRVGALEAEFEATPTPGEMGVQANGRVDQALVNALAVGGRIAATYGEQSAGPFEPPPGAVLTRFVQACREYLDPGLR